MEPIKQNIIEQLRKVQMEIKAPKGQYNAFGKYKYKKCEDILEAAKKVMPEGCIVQLTDEVVNISGRFYVKATAVFQNHDYNSGLKCTAYAREDEAQKGKDCSQVTLSASSYARKAALNGLFAIDDSADDTNVEEEKPPKTQPVKNDFVAGYTKINENQALYLMGLIKDAGKTLENFLSFHKIEKIQDFPVSLYDKWVAQLKTAIEKSKGV